MNAKICYTNSHDLFWASNFFQGCYATTANGKKKKVALCQLCNQKLQNTSIKRLNGHRKSCNRIGNQSKRFKSELPENDPMNDSKTQLQIVSAISLIDVKNESPMTVQKSEYQDNYLHEDVTPSSSTELKLCSTVPQIGKNVDKLLAKFLITYNIPFDIVENPKFKELITEINSEYQLPNKNKISSVLLKEIDNDTVKDEMKFAKNDSILLIMSRETKFLEYEVLTYLYTQEDLKKIFLKLYKFSGKINITELIESCSNLAKQYYCTNIFGVVCNIDYLHFQSKDDVKNLFDKMITVESELFYSECHLQIINKILHNNAQKEIVIEASNILKEYSCYWDEIAEHNDLEENHNSNIYFMQKPYDTLEGITYILGNVQKLKEGFAKLIATDSISNKLNLLEDENFISNLKQKYEYMKSLNEIKTKIMLPGVSLAEVVQELVLIHCKSSHDLVSKNTILALRPLGIAANILHPIFRGEKMSKEIRDIGEEFLMHYLDSDGLESYENYLSKTDIFQILSKKPNLTWPTYWSLVSRKHPNLSKFAKRLLKMPAISISEVIFENIVNQNDLSIENFNKFLHIQHSLKNND